MNNLSRFFLFCLITLTTVAKSQTTYSWASYPTRCSGASVYTQPNMTVSVSGSGFSNRGPQAAASSCASTAGNRYISPKYVTTGNASAPDWQQTGLGIGVDWSNIVSNPPNSTVDVVFTNAVCTPLNFSIYDINSGTCCGVSVIWKDIVTISAVDGLGNTIYPLGANVTPMTGGNSYNAGTGTITAGNYGATNSVTNISFPSTQVAAIKSLKIVYRSGAITNDPYTVSATDPDPQYIIISNITASSPTVAISASAIPCGSTTTTLSSTTNATSATYSWTGSAGTSISSPTAASTSVTGAGTYTLTVVSGGVGGCTASAVYTVTASGSAPNVTMAATNEITCSSTSVNISGSSSTPGVTYAWTGPGAISPSNLATGAVSTPGTYTLTVTETSSGCTNTGTVSVTSNTVVPALTIGANQTIDCINTTANLSGGSVRDVNYLWTGPGAASPNNTSTTSVTTAGVYTLTVTDILNGCVNTGTVSVTSLVSPPNITTNAAQTLTCATTSVTVSGNSSTAGVNFSWAGSGAISPSNTNSGSVSSPGVYTLTVTNPVNGCTSTGTVSVSQNTTPPALTMGANQTITCTNTTATISGSSVTAGVNYSWAGPGAITPNNQSSGTVNSNGTYSLTVTDPSNGCVNTNTVSVAINNTLPNVNAGSTQEITCATSTINLIGSSSSSGVDFLWTGPGAITPNNQANGSVSVAGIYTLTVTNPSNGCSNSNTVNVTANTTVPDITMGSNQTIDCASSLANVSGSSTTNGVSFAWTGPGTISPNNTSNGNVTNAGTYTLTITNPTNGCSSSGTILVNQNSTAPNLSVGSNQTITCNVGTVTISGTSLTSGVNYLWSGPSVITPNNQASGTVSASGTYTLTVTDPSNNCSTSNTVEVFSNAVLPDVSAGNSQTITCSASSVVLTGSSATSGLDYSWSGASAVTPNNQAIGSVSAAGTYTLTVTDPTNGCSNTSSVVVSENTTLPNISMSSNQIIDCISSSAIISGSTNTSGVIYSWAGPGIINPSNAASGSVTIAGTYSLTITDPSNGCSVMGTIDVANNSSAPIITMGLNQVINCNTTSVSINGNSNVSGVIYSWSGPGTINPNNTSSGMVSVAGTYTLLVTDPSNGCSSSGTLDVIDNTIIPDLLMSTDQTLDCNTLSAIISGNSATLGLDYTWSGPSTVSPSNASSGTVSVAGTYTLLVNNPSNGCSVSGTINVLPANLPTQPIVSASASTTFCDGDSVILSSSSSINNLWSNGATTQTILVNTPGNYSVTVNDINGCIAVSLPLNVVVNTLPIVSAAASSVNVCSGSMITLTGSGANNYSWTNGVSDGIAFPISSSQTYTVTGTDLNGCSDTAEVTINVNSLPLVIATINSPSVCAGASVVLSASGLAVGGNYVWSNGVIDNVSFVPNSSTTYTVTGTDVNGCIDTATVSVIVNTPPIAPVITTIGSGTSVCSGQSIILSSNPSSGITWQPNGETSATIVVSNSGVYSASITDANSCTSLLSSISVVINPSPIINVSALSLDTVKCGGVNGSINNVEITGGTQPYTYNWINSTTNLSVGSSLTLTNVVTGNYQMIVEDSNGCSDSSAVIPLPSVGGVSVNLTGTPLNGMDPLDVNLLATTTGSVITYNWYLNSSYTITTSLGTHSLLGLTFGNYTASVVVLDQYGCLDTAKVTIFVDSEIKVVIPNVFTPNGDNINEVFSFELKGVKNFEAQIFNRWGQKLYSWNALNGGWDGKLSNGEWASEGTYYFIVDYTDVEDVKVNKAGYFLLVK